MKILWCLGICLALYQPCQATGDSLHYLTAEDTLQLVFDEWQQMYVIHYLERGQTLYSLARFYGLRLGELLNWNPEWRTQIHPKGAAVRIPIPPQAIVKHRTSRFSQKQFAPVVYQIRKHDTFYGLSHRLFHIDADTLLARNPFLASGLHPGQLIQVGWLPVAGIPDSLRHKRHHPLWEESERLREQFIMQTFHAPPKTIKGAAYWNKDLDNYRSLFALLDGVPRGSIIAVRNPMTRREVFVRVIGQIPDSPFFEHVVVVVSPAVAKMLGAIDARFFVEVEYFK